MAEAPPGIPPEVIQYQLAHADEDISVGLKVLTILGVVLATAAVVLRLASRRLLKVGIKWDDWLVIIALICLMTQCVIHNIMLYAYGEGKHAIVVGPEKIHGFLQMLYIFTCFAGATLLFVKYSILLLYLRIFVTKRFQTVVKITLAILIPYQIATLLVTIFCCTPIKKNWEPAGKASCINQLVFYQTIFGIHLFSDFWILLLPLPVILKLQCAFRQKLVLCAMFTIGLVVCITTIFRIVTFQSINYLDVTWSFTPHLYWTTAESSLAVVCACLPALRPVFTRFGSMVSNSGFSLRSGSGSGASGSRKVSSATGASGKSGSHNHSEKGRSHYGSASTGSESEPEKGHDSFVPARPENTRTKAWYEEEVAEREDVEMGNAGGKGRDGIQVRKDVEWRESERRGGG